MGVSRVFFHAWNTTEGMTMTSQTTSTAQGIITHVGGVGNIKSLTHCATRLRFELVDASKVDKDALDAIPAVLGVVDQSGDRLQIIMGGAVAANYTEIMNLPEMKDLASHAKSDSDVKDAERAKVRGKHPWMDAFFEYLSDSFRPILGVLLGASLVIAFAAVLDALGVVDFRATDKSASWIFVDAMWRSVFYFLPIMVAYNAAKKLNVDPWVGGSIMAALMTPEFISLSNPERFLDTICTTNETLGTQACVAHIFGIPMQLSDYGGQVFVPLMMVAVLAPLYKGLQKVFPANLQMVFVPFISLAVMIPLTAFLIGPLGVWLGSGIGTGLAWMNTNAPFVFAILIPMLYPFLVPLGLHWPLNALMLINIQTLGYDFIQGPMGAWNFACFGATAGVLVLSIRHKETQMRQTAMGALAAGLLGGISEPSLYGIHLRFKRIYPRMLIGCFAGGLTIAILSAPFHGVKTSAFVFTSLLTIPVFNPMWVYGIAVAVAFVVAMVLVVFSDYMTKEERAQLKVQREAAENAISSGDTEVIKAPVDGELISLDEVPDPVFSSRALGEGVGIVPSSSQIVAPVSGIVQTVAETGHAFGITTDDSVEVLVHVGIDTVKMGGDGFEVHVTQGQRVVQGESMITVDFDKVRSEGFSPITVMTVVNTDTLASVSPVTAQPVHAGDVAIDVTR